MRLLLSVFLLGLGLGAVLGLMMTASRGELCAVLMFDVGPGGAGKVELVMFERIGGCELSQEDTETLARTLRDTVDRELRRRHGGTP